jgi:hypothetical protein
VSTHEAIAAVTETVRLFLFERLGGAACSAKPPDLARDTSTGNQVNLFLYHMSRNPAWSNMDLPSQTKPGEAGRPPLALDLSYLLTAYGTGDSDVEAQRTLGRAMRLLHDHPVLGREELDEAGQPIHLDAQLGAQIERIRISHEPLPLDELTKLWTSFQTGYRISTTYKLTVVLIDSQLPPRMAPPVLSRGEKESGAEVIGDAPVWPSLERVELKERHPRHRQPSARLGDTLVLTGRRLAGGGVHLAHRLAGPFDLPPDQPAGATRLEVTLPNTPAARGSWPAGLYAASVAVPVAGRSRTSNELPFPLAPRLSNIQAGPRADDSVPVTVAFSPDVHHGQRASLLLADREVLADDPPAEGATSDHLTFTVAGATPGTFLVRLRIDGVDSLPFDPLASDREFDPAQQVAIP